MTFPLNLGDIIASPPLASSGYLDLAPGGRLYRLEELDDMAARLAGALGRRFRRGERIAIIAKNGAELTVAYLGIMRAGLVAVPVSHRLPKETVDFILSDCDARAVITDEVAEGLVGQERPQFRIDPGPGERFHDLLSAAPAAAVVPEPEEIAEILYTSGSTGRPKGVPLSHNGQLWALELFLRTVEPTERTIIVAPAYHMNGLFFTTVALAAGFFTISMPKFDARAFLEAAADHRCTLLSGIPTMFAMMARERDLIASLDLSCVKNVIIGSAPLTHALVERVQGIFPKAVLRNSYGTTESGPAMFGPHPDGLPRPDLALGYPYPGVDWRLVGGSSPNEGALETRTPAVLRGYLNLPEVTADRVVDGWYKTGDVLRRDDQGFFHFLGRADDMFNCGGENVYPGEVEKLLERHPSILQAAVVPADDEIKGAIPIAFVVPVPGETIGAEAVKQFALAHGPAYSHPRAVVFLDQLPLGGVHKIDRRELVGRAAEVAKALGR